MQLSQQVLFDALAEAEVIEDVYSAEIQAKTTASKFVRCGE